MTPVNGIEDLISQLPIDAIAARLGVDPATAEQAVQHALPAIVGGLHANAQNPAAAASLADALQQHDNGLTDSGQVNLDDVDTADGQKIVNHVFGANHDAVVSQLGGLGLGNGLVKSLLPMLAPIVMSFLAKQFRGGGSAGATAAAGAGAATGTSSGGGLTDILGQIMGGGSGGGLPSIGGIDLGQILGGLLGSGRR